MSSHTDELQPSTDGAPTATDSQTDDEAPPALGARENWWYEETGHPGYGDDTDTASPGDPDAGPDAEYARRRAEWLAHRILKQTAPALLCPIAAQEPPRLEGGRARQLCAWLFEDEHLEHNPAAVHTANESVELTAPRAFIPPQARAAPERDYTEGRPYRVNETHGYLTGPLIQDRPTEEFLATVNLVLALARERRGLRAATADRIRTLARDRKTSVAEADGTDHRDVTILAEVLECIEQPDRVLEAKGY